MSEGIIYAEETANTKKLREGQDWSCLVLLETSVSKVGEG